MKLSTKISTSMGLLTILMAGLTSYFIIQLSKLNDVSREISERQVPLMRLRGEINKAASEYRLTETLHIYSSNDQQMKEYEKIAKNWADMVAKDIKEINSLLITPAGKEAFQKYLTYRASYRESSSNTLTLSREHKTEQAMALLLGESATAYDNMSTAMSELTKLIEQRADHLSENASTAYETSRLIGIILAAASLSLSIVLTLLMVRNVLNQLGKDPGELDAIAQRVVDGDYNIDDGSKKIGVFGAIVNMVSALKGHIENAQRESENAKEQSAKAQAAMLQAEAAGQEAQRKTQAMLIAADKLEQAGNVISSASTELAAQIEQSDRGAAESAQRLSEAATAMQEMNATVQEVARNASTASNESMETRNKAQHGASIVEQSLQSIEGVRQISIELKGDMEQLNEHAQNITRIMGVISDIADQTNLLALNAAIEAARAGEAGRGFAVVADEVRKLAEKTMSSTADVSSAIEAIQESTQKSMASVDNAVEQVNSTTELAGLSGQALQEIVTTVDTTADQVHAIATASEEQSAASEEINQSIAHVDNMVRQTAEAMSEAARAVSDLAAQAQGLTDLILDLKNA